MPLVLFDIYRYDILIIDISKLLENISNNIKNDQRNSGGTLRQKETKRKKERKREKRERREKKKERLRKREKK